MSNGEEIASEIPDPQPMPPMPGQQPMPPVQIPPFEKFQLILAVLRDDILRNYKLDIESDSIVELDQRADRAERLDAMNAAGSFLNQLEPLIQKAPGAAQYAKSMMRFVMRSYKAGKEIEGELISSLDAMVQQIQQANSQPPQDPNESANQAKLQIAQMDNQIEQQKLQLEMTLLQIKAQQDGQKALLDAEDARFERELKAQELGVKGQEAQLDYAIKIEMLRLEEMKITQNAEITSVNMQLKGMQEAFSQKIEQAYLKLDEFAVVSKENEKLIEEKRLASQERLDTARLLSDHQSRIEEIRSKAAAPPAQPEKAVKQERSAPPIVINNHMPKSVIAKKASKNTSKS